MRSNLISQVQDLNNLKCRVHERLSEPTLHLDVVVFDCSSLAHVLVETNKKTATREKERTPRMFCSELARDWS